MTARWLECQLAGAIIDQVMSEESRADPLAGVRSRSMEQHV